MMIVMLDLKPIVMNKMATVKMNIRFDGKRALVTGGGKGIGRGIAKKLLECGAETYVLDKIQSDLDSLSQECPSIKTVQCDLFDQQAVAAAVRSCGTIDRLVNNAGILVAEPFLEVTLENFDRTMQINLRAPLQISQIVAKGMIERKSGGSIVNISSKTSMRALINCTAYGTSKAALDQLTRSMCLELGKYNIRINAVNPTVVHTQLSATEIAKHPQRADATRATIPQGRFAEIDEVVSVVIFLLSDAASMVNGVCLPVDGGCLASLMT